MRPRSFARRTGLFTASSPGTVPYPSARILFSSPGGNSACPIRARPPHGRVLDTVAVCEARVSPPPLVLLLGHSGEVACELERHASHADSPLSEWRWMCRGRPPDGGTCASLLEAVNGRRRQGPLGPPARSTGPPPRGGSGGGRRSCRRGSRVATGRVTEGRPTTAFGAPRCGPRTRPPLPAAIARYGGVALGERGSRLLRAPAVSACHPWADQEIRSAVGHVVGHATAGETENPRSTGVSAGVRGGT